VEFTTETQREPLAPLTTRFKVVRFEDDGSLLLTVLGFGEETGTFRLHPDGTLEHVFGLGSRGNLPLREHFPWLLSYTHERDYQDGGMI
jgi:hypothetical protein